MVIYGIQFNANDYGWDKTNDLDDDLVTRGVGEISIVTGYSVSAYEPEFAIIGVKLTSENCLFNPLNLTELYATANEKLADVAEKGIPSKILAEAEKAGIEGKLELLIVDETDD